MPTVTTAKLLSSDASARVLAFTGTTVVAANEVRSVGGLLYRRKTAGTTRATFDSTEQALWDPVGGSGSGGTDASQLTTGTLPPARIGAASITVNQLSATGTPSATTYLRGDGTWSTPAGGSSTTDASLLTSGTLSLARLPTSIPAANLAADVARTSALTTETSRATAAENTLTTSLGNKVDTSTYVTGLAGKVDTTDARLSDQRIPQDGSVSLTKLSATGTKSATTFLAGDNTFKPITATISDATTTTNGGVRLAGDLGGTANAPTVPALTNLAPKASPTFTGTVTVPTPAVSAAATPKSYVDSAVVDVMRYKEYTSEAAAQADVTAGNVPAGYFVIVSS